MIKTQADELLAEVATLKRQHEQLRAAAEPASKLICLLAIQYLSVHGMDLVPMERALRAALDATPAEATPEVV